MWQLILTGLSWCDRFLEGEPRDRFRDYVRSLLRPSIDRLGWEASSDEPDLVRALRGTLAQSLAVLGDDPEAKAQMRELEGEARGGGDVDAHLASAAVQVVATNGDGDDFARYWQMVHDGVTPQEQLRYLYALARFRDPELFDSLLASTLTDDVRPQDAPFLLATATTNRDLGDRAWRFIAEHWDAALGSVRGVEHHLAGVGRAVPVVARAAASGGRVLRDPSDPAGRPDAGPDARAPADLRLAPRTRRERPGAVVLRFVLTHRSAHLSGGSTP